MIFFSCDKVAVVSIIWGMVVQTACAGAGKPPLTWKVHKGDGWVVTAPEDWSWPAAFPLQPPKRLHVIGDGRKGIPLVDGCLKAIQIGLSVDLYDKGGPTAKELLDRFLKELKTAPTFQLRLEPGIEDVILADRTKAQRMTSLFEKTDRGRLSCYYHLVGTTADGRSFVVTGWITCGKEGAPFIKLSGLQDFLKAHVDSFVLDPTKLDEASLRKTYSKHPLKVAEAIRSTMEANQLLEKDPPQAIQGFTSALEQFEHIPAAHNGISWALLTSAKPSAEDIKKAVRHAETAVSHTERRDPSSLDTLALAYFKSGERTKAIAAIQEAIKLDPRSTRFPEQLKKYESAK